jgi:hypothetical protein
MKLTAHLCLVLRLTMCVELYVHQSMRHHIPEDSTILRHLLENLKSNMFLYVSNYRRETAGTNVGNSCPGVDTECLHIIWNCMWIEGELAQLFVLNCGDGTVI